MQYSDKMIHYGILNNGYVYHHKNRKGHQVLLLAWKSKMAKVAKKTKNWKFYVFGVFCICVSQVLLIKNLIYKAKHLLEKIQ